MSRGKRFHASEKHFLKKEEAYKKKLKEKDAQIQELQEQLYDQRVKYFQLKKTVEDMKSKPSVPESELDKMIRMFLHSYRGV